MKANELRIGNWVKRKGLVVQCDHMSVDNCYSWPEQYEPIPITEEWLVKFGFEEVKRYGDGVWRVHDFILIFYPDECFLCDCDIDVKIKHVHQLQNLYFALTGKEL